MLRLLFCALSRERSRALLQRRVAHMFAGAGSTPPHVRRRAACANTPSRARCTPGDAAARCHARFEAAAFRCLSFHAFFNIFAIHVSSFHAAAAADAAATLYTREQCRAAAQAKIAEYAQRNANVRRSKRLLSPDVYHSRCRHTLR
jgi:hypothetical protein